MIRHGVLLLCVLVFLPWVSSVAALPPSRLIFVGGPATPSTSICKQKSLTFCEEAHVLLNRTTADAKSEFSIIGRAYETVDPITWSGDSAPGYFMKRGYSNDIGTAGVLKVLRVAFNNDLSMDGAGVCTATGVNNHFMQATIQVYGVALDRCQLVSAVWNTVAYDAMTATQIDTDASTPPQPAAAGDSKTMQTLVTVILVIVCIFFLAACLWVGGAPALKCLLGLCRMCFNK